MFQPSEGEIFEYKGTPQGSKWLIVSIMKACRMLIKECTGYLASIVDTTIKVVTELLDVLWFANFQMCFLRNCKGYHQIERLNLKLSCYLDQLQYPKHLIEWL